MSRNANTAFKNSSEIGSAENMLPKRVFAVLDACVGTRNQANPNSIRKYNAATATQTKNSIVQSSKHGGFRNKGGCDADRFYCFPDPRSYP